jgi:hypothetical protein
MDSFEQVIATLLQRQGYWTMTSLKVELTKAEKQKIGRPSSTVGAGRRPALGYTAVGLSNWSKASKIAPGSS